MSSNERPLQKPPTRGTARKSSNPVSVNANHYQNVRDTQYPEDDYLLGEDDPYASNPPKPHTSAVRLNPGQGQGVRRNSRDIYTDAPSTRRVPPNIPPRSTQKQSPRQATGAVPIRPARSASPAYDGPSPGKRGRRNIHWLLYVGIGMLAALALWALANVALNWGTNEYNTIVYGYPRTYQADAVVGHSDSSVNPSHFIALNLHGQIIVIEFPGGDPSKAIDYTGPDLVGSGEDQLPVTLSFSDLNHDGKIDMIIRVSDRDFVFYNNGTKFVVSNPAPASTSSTPAANATP